MGLTVSIYRNGYDSDLNLFHGKSAVTLVDVDGPFEPTTDQPAARLAANAFGEPIIVPVDPPGHVMFGGTYAASSDSRFRRAVGRYAALPVHDRYEPPSTAPYYD